MTKSSDGVRRARATDLRGTARLHRRHLPDGFFARLGTGFLRAYHRTFADSPAAEVLVARTGERPVGMLVGTLDNAGHYRWALRRRGPILAATGVVAMLRRPRLAAEFVRTRIGRYLRALGRFLRPRRRDPTAAGTGADAAAPQVAVLTHVAVAPEARGNGAGRELVRAFAATARRHGADEARLITPSRGPGTDFYRSLGWRHLGRRRAADGTLVEEFVLPL